MSGSSSLVDRRVVHRAWVDSIPAHWDVVSLRWCAIRFSGGTPSKDNDDFWEGGDIPWLNSGAVNAGLIVEASDFITEAAYLSSSAKWVPKGALVIALAGQGKTKGMVAQLGFAATCNQSMAAIVPSRRIDSRYLYWWLVSNYSNIRNMAGGEARDGLNLEMIGSIPCLAPPLEDQAYIAAHLDRETAKIDTLIAKKRELIAKLKEQRSALISRTVTRGLPPEAAKAVGLDPNPPMKDSGVEWLGEVPAHWSVSPLGYLVDMFGGGTPDKSNPDYWDGDIPWVSAKDMKTPFIQDSEDHISGIALASSAASLVPTGSILIVVRGMILLHTFPVALTLAEVSINQDMKALVCGASISPKFLFWAISGAANHLVASADEAAHGTKKIDTAVFKRLELAFPTIPEQVEVVKYLDNSVASLDILLARIETAITRLTEYRAALITAAVTGQLAIASVR